MDSPTIELVRFRLKAGVTEEAFVAAAEKAQATITQFPGYIRRTLMQNADGLWIDLVYWHSHAEALAAAETFGSKPDLAAFGALIDETSIDLQHLAPVRAWDDKVIG
jgi:hypothetical protein